MKNIIKIRRVVIMKRKSRSFFHSFFIVFVLDTSFLYKPKFKILTKLRYQNVVNWDDFGPKRLLCPTIAILINILKLMNQCNHIDNMLNETLNISKDI